MMDALKQHRLTLVWLGLVGVTALSWALGSGGNHSPSTVATAAILVISAIKARLIMREFMEINHASIRLKRYAEAWVGFTLTMLLMAYFFGAAIWRWMEIYLLHLL
jgi:hypothetical protein